MEHSGLISVDDTYCPPAQNYSVSYPFLSMKKGYTITENYEF